MYSKMDRSISGKVSETVYRDKMGRIKDVKMDKVKSREQERKEIEDIKKFMEWGRGYGKISGTVESTPNVLMFYLICFVESLTKIIIINVV